MGSCESMGEFLSALIDGELADERSAEVESHLRDCEECRNLRDRFLDADRCIAASEIAPSPGFADAISGALTNGDVSSGDVSSGHVSNGDVPNGDVSIGDSSNGGFSNGDSSNGGRRRRSFGLRMLGSWPFRVAAATVLVLGLSPLLFVVNDEVLAGVAVPLATLEVIHQEVLRDQQATIKTLEWELRALKLQVDCLVLSREQAQSLRERLDHLLTKVTRKRSKGVGEER